MKINVKKIYLYLYHKKPRTKLIKVNFIQYILMSDTNLKYKTYS